MIKFSSLPARRSAAELGNEGGMTSFIQSIGGSQAGTKRPQDRRNYFPLKVLTSIQATVSSLHPSIPFIYRYRIKIFITLSCSTGVGKSGGGGSNTGNIMVFNIDQFAIHQHTSIYYHFPGCSILFLHAQYGGKKPPGTPLHFILPCCCLPIMPCSSRLDYL